MKVIDVLKLNRETLELLYRAGVRPADYRYIPMYEDYLQMVNDGYKMAYIIATLSARYNVGERTVYSVIARLSRTCKL